MTPDQYVGFLATIVGLICNFDQQRQSQSQPNTADFLEYLEQHGYNSIRSHIESDDRVLSAIEQMLRLNQDELRQRISELDQTLAQVLSHVRGFSSLAAAVRPGDSLSSQALEVLTIFANSQQETMVLIPIYGGNAPLLSVLNYGNLTYPEPRFIEDDLETLTRLGLIAVNHVTEKNSSYRMTRFGFSYVQSLEQSTSP